MNRHRQLRLRLPAALLAAVCASTVTSVLTASPAGAKAVPTLGYTAVTPCRVVSTTSGQAVAAGSTRSFRIAGTGAEFAAQGGTAGGCGIPDDVPAVVVSVTAVAPSGDGFLRVFAADVGEPNATFLNYTDGTGITNTGTVKLASLGALDLKVAAHTSATDVVIDVQGFYSSTSAVNFRPMAPCRVLNTAAGAGTPFAPNESRSVQVAGTGANFAAQGGKANGCGVPDGAVAVEVSVTAVDPSATGFVRAAKAGTADAAMKGTVLNYTSAQNITNTATLDLAAAGTLDLKLRNLGASTDVVIDVQGYYSTTATGRFKPVTPCRVLNTKPGAARLQANGTRGVRTSGVVGFATQGAGRSSLGCGITAAAIAVVASVTAVDPSSSGFLRSWPAGTTPPNATMLNYADGRPITNTGALATATSGSLDLILRNFAGSTDVVVDVQGYFVTSSTDNRLTTIQAGYGNACALRPAVTAHSDLRCWGRNSFGHFANGAFADTVDLTADDATRSIGAVVAPYVAVRQVSMNAFHACALRATVRAVDCWGAKSPALGNPAPAGPVLRARGTDLAGADAIDVTAGTYSTCIVATDGTVRCWGQNDSGQLGNGTTTDSVSPVTVAGITNAVQVRANGIPSPSTPGHACALLDTGGVKCWGKNNFGQLGNGTTTDSKVPVTVTGIAGAVQVVTGEQMSCALLAGGTARCWGGQPGLLGNGSTAASSVPVTVATTVPIVQLAAGSVHTCGLLLDGRVVCWGAGSSGRLGTGSTDTQTAPDLVTTTLTIGPGVALAVELDGVTDVAAGEASTCAVRTNSTGRCWGNNNSGEIGDGTTTDRLRAVPVTALS